jgi:hypothetical protein
LVPFIGVLNELAQEVKELPPPTRPSRFADRLLRRTLALEASLFLISERIWRPHFRDALRERFHLAGMRVVLVAPPEILDGVLELSVLLSQAERGPPDWGDRWDDAQGRLIKACRRALGEN